MNIVKRKKLCFNCLGSHRVRNVIRTIPVKYAVENTIQASVMDTGQRKLKILLEKITHPWEEMSIEKTSHPQARRLYILLTTQRHREKQQRLCIHRWNQDQPFF